MGAVLAFYAFGRKQKEEAYNTISVCLLNVFRLSIGQPLRKDPKRWSMKFVLLSWVLFQMHASIIYQGDNKSRTNLYIHVYTIGQFGFS